MAFCLFGLGFLAGYRSRQRRRAGACCAMSGVLLGGLGVGEGRAGLPARNQNELEGRVRSVIRRLQLQPQRVSSYFRHPRIAYAA